MKRKFIFCLLLCIGVATAFGQKSEVKVMGVPFGSTYEEFTSAFKEKGFSRNMMSYVKNDFVEIYNIYGTFMTYQCSIEMRATILSHTVYQIKIDFPYRSNDNYKDLPQEQQYRAIISLLEEKYGKAVLATNRSGRTVVKEIDDGKVAFWKLPDNIKLEVIYRASEGHCVFYYGGDDALNGILQKEVELRNQQKAIENQNQLSGSDI